MAAIAVAALTIVAVALSAYMQYEQAQTQGKVLRYNAKVQENQAIAARQQAEFVAKQQREQGRRVMARQRALYGAADVEIGAGSPLLVVADTARQVELDAQATLAGGAAREQGFRTQATLDRFTARATERYGAIGAGTTLLSGFASAYGSYAGATPSAGTLRVPTRTSSTGAGYYEAS